MFTPLFAFIAVALFAIVVWMLSFLHVKNNNKSGGMPSFSLPRGLIDAEDHLAAVSLSAGMWTFALQGETSRWGKLHMKHSQGAPARLQQHQTGSPGAADGLYSSGDML